MYKKITAFLLSIVIIFIFGEIIVRVFKLGSSFPYQKAKNDILMYEYIPNFKGRMWGKEFKTNLFGYRDYDYPLNKSASSFRIVVFGDSITVGTGLLLDEAYTKILEVMLNDSPPESDYNHFEVMNMGICAYNTIREVKLIEEKGLAFDPDMIIIQYCLDDIMPSIVETISEVGYKKTWVRIIKFIKDITFTLRFSRFIQYIRHNFIYRIYVMMEEKRVEKMGGLANALYSKSGRNWQETRNALSRLAQLTKKDQINVLLVIFPRFESLNDDYPYRKCHQLIKDTCFELGIPVLDLFDAYEGMNPQLLRLSEKTVDWWHPNKLGHEIAAQEIYTYIGLNKDDILGIKR